MFKLLFVIVCLTISTRVECLYAGESCEYKNESGICTPLSQCTSIVNEVERAGRPMPMHIRRKLQDLNCGFAQFDPMICCIPSRDNGGSNNIPPTIPTVSPTPNNGEWDTNEHNRINTIPTNKPPLIDKNGIPNIEGHPNLSLLPINRCGISENDRVWGGNRTRLYEMPWMVLLSYQAGRLTKLNCGGTLINKWYVLTAAHCVTFLNKLKLNGVILGEHDVRQDPDCETVEGVEYCAPSIRNVSISKVIANTGYTPKTLQDDIALIRLSEPADFSLDSMKPICLPVTTQLQNENLEELNGAVAGWGYTETGLQSPVLLSVNLPILKNPDCRRIYNGTPEIRDQQLCAGGIEGQDSCAGDSGGPIMYPGKVNANGVRIVQRGIVSFGSKRCAIGGFPGVYTRIAYYMDWILNNIES